MTLLISKCATQTKIKFTHLSTIEDQFHPLGRRGKFSQKHSDSAPNSISSVLVKCTKTEYFSQGGSNFASDFPSCQACQNAVIHVFEKQIYILLRIDQVLCIFTDNNGIIRNDIKGNILFYRVVRVIPH